MVKEEGKRKVSPAAARARVAAARKGGILVGSAMTRLLSKYAKPEGADAFARWRMQPDTQMFIDALRECALNPSVTGHASTSYEVEFGVTSGFQVASMLLDDPSQIFDRLFGATPGSANEEVPSDYSSPPVGEADGLDV